MATNFPDSPSTNDTHSVGDLTWIWDGTVWKLTVPPSLTPAGSTTQIQYNSSGSFAGSANFTFDGTSTVTLASTDAGSSAAPILELYRNSSSPADADYLGQIKFQGEDDGGAKVLYAKITGKIDDASNTTEDGIIEIAHMKAGSNNISARFTSSALKLINGTGLEVADGLLTLGSTAVTATAAELNILDGVTSTTAELNILDGVTATASELNLLDGITAGTVSASLAVIPDSNKDISGFRNITSSGTGDITTKLEVLSDTEAHSGSVAFYKSEAAGAARLDTNAVYGRLDFYGRTASDGYYLSAQMKALVGDSFSSDNQAPSDIEFSVTPVGQTSPVKKLVVRGGTATTDSAALEIWHPGGDNKGGRVDFIDHDGTGLGYFGYSNNANWYIKNNISSGNMFIECEGAIYIRAEGEYELSLTSNGLEPYADSGYKLGSSSKKFSEIHGDAIHIGGTEVTATAAELNIMDGVTATATELNIMDGVTSTTAELNILDGVTSTAAELNILDGVTSTAAELNILDGVTSTTAELNILDGVTSTTAELNILDGVTSTAAELNLVDGITAGTVAASKAVIVDSDKDVTGFRNITATGEIDAATLDISGDADIDGTTNLDVVDIDGAVDMASTLTVHSHTFLGDHVQTGQSSFTCEPWSQSTIMLGNYGSVGTQGSYRTSLSWNYERDANSDFTHLDVNSYAQAGDFSIGHTGFLFNFHDDYENNHTGNPTTVANMLTDGQLNCIKSGADGGIVLGQAFSSSYVGLRTGNMSMTSGNEYIIMSNGNHTFISAGNSDASDVYIRAGGNSTSCQIHLDTSENDVNVTGSLVVKGTSESHISNNTSANREILQLRGKTANTDGAGLNLYGDGDSSNAGKTIFFNNNGTSMVIDADKQVRKPGIAAFRVANADGGGGYMWESTSTGTLPFNSDSGEGRFDNGNNFNTSTYTFTAPVDGYYYFGCSFFFYSTYDTSKNVYIAIKASDGSETTVNRGEINDDGGLSIQAVYKLDENDTVSVQVVGGHSSTADKNVFTWRTHEYNSFSGFLIG